MNHAASHETRQTAAQHAGIRLQTTYLTVIASSLATRMIGAGSNFKVTWPQFDKDVLDTKGRSHSGVAVNCVAVALGMYTERVAMLAHPPSTVL